jgi:hypothetical protein
MAGIQFSVRSRPSVEATATTIRHRFCLKWVVLAAAAVTTIAGLVLLASLVKATLVGPVLV